MPENSNLDLESSKISAARLPLKMRHKIALCFSLLLVTVATAYWLLFQNEMNRSLEEYRDILGDSVSEQTAASVRELVLVNDLLGLNVVLTQLIRDNNVLYVTVYDVDGNLLTSAGQPPNGINEPSVIYTAEISVQEAIAGSVQLILNTGAINSYQIQLRNLFLLILGISLVLTVTTAFALAGRITAPMRRLLEAINSRHINNTAIEDNIEETPRLQQAVGDLLDHCQNLEEQLLETGIWQAGSRENGNEPSRLAASILVTEVVNINTAIELLHPATLANLLKEYIYYLGQSASLYGGQFHRLNGDSLMLCFDAETCGDRHPINAIYCAGLFQSVMARINNDHRNKGQQTLDLKMAIHSGDVFFAPQIHSNKDSESTDGVFSNTIDIAYFLCQQCTATELLISESTFSQAGEFEDLAITDQDEISITPDNISFMTYILTADFSTNMALIQKQCGHILESVKDDT